MNERVLYNIKRGPHGYGIGKFDQDLNLLAAYNTSTDYCSCPAGPRPTCRHRKMLPRMLSRVATDEFYCYETQTWHQPLAREAPLEGNAPVEAEGRHTRVESPLPAQAGNVGYERQGTGYDPEAGGYELQGRCHAPEPPTEITRVVPEAPVVAQASDGIRRR